MSNVLTTEAGHMHGQPTTTAFRRWRNGLSKTEFGLIIAAICIGCVAIFNTLGVHEGWFRQLPRLLP